MNSEFTLKRYNSIDDVQLAFHQVEVQEFTIEDLKKFKMHGLDSRELPIEFSYAQQKEGIELMGYWGWIDEDKVIHYWIDSAKKIPLEELIHFFAHEIGHRTGMELKDKFDEEMRAEDFGHVATLAYKFAIELKQN